MRLPSECYQTKKRLKSHLPHLSQPQLTGLALWVCGAILAGSACHTPWPPPSRPGATGTTCASGQGVALRRRPTARLPARPSWILISLLRATAAVGPLAGRSSGLALAIDPTLKGGDRPLEWWVQNNWLRSAERFRCRCHRHRIMPWFSTAVAPSHGCRGGGHPAR